MPSEQEEEVIRAVTEAIAQDEAARGLAVEVDGASIIVTMAGTKFSVTYQKPADSPQLVMTHSWVAPNITTPAVSEFRARAWRQPLTRRGSSAGSGYRTINLMVRANVVRGGRLIRFGGQWRPR